MNRFIVVIGALLVVLGCSLAWNREVRSVAAAARPSVETKVLSPLEEQLIAYEKAIPEAQKKHDIDFYKRTLTDDFVAVGTDAKLHAKDEVLEDLRDTELVEYRPYDIQVVQLNDGAAVVTYDVIIRMARYDEEIPRYQHISSVWVKQGDQWKLKFQQATAAQ
jgi:hypothetical protein